MPILLLSPLIVTRDSAALRAMRGLVGGLGGRALTAFARSKRRKLVTDESYVRKQLMLLVRKDRITADLLREAQARIADPRMDAVTDRTAETLRSVLTPTDVKVSDAASMVLFGNGPVDRKARRRLTGTVVEGAWSAPMIDTPEVVAQHLRAFLHHEGQ